MFDWLYQRLVAWFLGFFGGAKAVGDAILTWLIGQAAPFLPDAGSALSASELQETLAQINYFIPFSELVTYALSYAALWALVGGVKWVKSWFVGASS